MRSATLTQEVFLNEDLNTINDKLLDSWILMTKRNLIDELLKEGIRRHASILIYCRKGLLQSCQNSSLCLFVLVGKKLNELLHLGRLECLLEKDSKGSNHLDSFDKNQHVWVFEHVNHDVQER